ncbi:leucyl aminopeptidase [Desulfobulbus rhabdoformis]|uniref:leucyl aminopeptidase n=1 Tax=Desulfobulbus rhabdoformis TaxID=34032 RepID=UPI0019665D0E|nr:leucyl aminopeptidase [Desulfobulbus rhabdoformis]
MDTDTLTIQVFAQNPKDFSGDLLVYLVEEDIAHLGDFGKPLNPVLQQIWSTGDFKGSKKQTFLFYPALLDKKQPVAAKRVLLVGLGKQDDDINIRREQLRLACGTIAKQAASIKAKDVLLVLAKEFLLDAEEIAQCSVEGVMLGSYRFDTYKQDKEGDDAPVRLERFALHHGGLSASAVQKGLERGRIIGQATLAARDMANQPGNGWTPNHFAEYAKKLAKKTSLKCKVLDKSALQKLGMGGILGVNQGSAQPPALVVMEHKTSKKNPTILLVGKGLTFDSGGISIKPGSGMEDMKYDMCGGAAVMGAMQAIAEIGLANVNVIGLVPATENLIGSASLKPGDVIRHYGGKSSEIINTDAEGRLILADALAYGIETFEPDAVIDLATLTGAVIIGLGHHHTGLLANNDQLCNRLLDAGSQVSEPLWRLPLGPEYRKQMDSRVADIKNAGSDRSAGCITAACYLQEFVGETPWAHMDIAGTAWDFTEKTYIPKGPSGTGVRTLVACLSQWEPLKPAEKK